MNTAQIRELIEFYPSKCRYLALYWDSQRSQPFWVTGRNDAPMPSETFWFIVREFEANGAAIERDESWLLIDLESGEATVLPWLEAESKLQQQFLEDSDLEFNAEFNAPAIARRVHEDWSEIFFDEFDER